MAAERDLPVLAFESAAAWSEWLEAEHATAPGVWIKMAKKRSGVPSVTLGEALDLALCYGWIDGQRNSFDDTYYLQKYTPRRPKSRWSKINCGKVEALIERGQMRPAGLREVERAKADGRWGAAYDSPRNVTVPDDLKRALDENEAAKAFFATLNSTNRYAILYRVHDAKRPETRARRIEQYVAMLAEGRMLY